MMSALVLVLVLVPVLVLLLVFVLLLARRGPAAADVVVEVAKDQVKNSIYAASEIVLVKEQLVLPR